MANTDEEDNSAGMCHCFGIIVDIDEIVHDSADQISPWQRVQGFSWEARETASHHGCCEEVEVLETVGQGTLVAEDACFGLRIVNEWGMEQ